MADWKEPKSDYISTSQVVPEIFNNLAENEKYLQENKITTEQVQEAVINSTQSATRESIGDKESVKGFFGKVRKWLADLKALAFKGTVGTNDIDNSAVNASKIDTNAVTTSKIANNAVETSKIKDGAVTDAKINSVSSIKVTGLHKVATSGSYNDLKDKPNVSGGDNPKVVFEGNANYYTYTFNFSMKDEYRYLVVVNGDYGIGISTKRTPQDEPVLNVLVPSYCYGTDSVMRFYIVTIVGYEGAPSYEGGGRYYVEGKIDINEGKLEREGYLEFDGQYCPTIQKIVELGKAY